MSPKSKYIYISLIVIMFALFIVFEYRIPIIDVDDVYISFHYAKNFANGNGLVFNKGEKVEGYSNFLWVILLAFFIKIGFLAESIAKYLGITCTLLTAYLSIIIIKHLSNKEDYHFIALIYCLLVFTYPSILYWSSAGLEMPLLYLSLILIVYNFTVLKYHANYIITGIIISLPAVIRFDGIIFWIVTLLYFIYTERKKLGKKILFAILISLIIVVSYHAFRIIYYGNIIPNTALAKGSIGLFRLIKGGISTTTGFLINNSILILFVPYIIYLYINIKPKKIEILLLLYFFIFLVYEIRVRGDYTIGHRYATLLLPIITLAFAIALIRLSETINITGKIRYRLIICVFILILSASHFLEYYEKDFHLHYKFRISESYRNIAKYLNSLDIRGERSLAYCEVGIIGYYLNGKIIDYYGLIDKYVAKTKYSNKIPFYKVKFGNEAIPENRGNTAKLIVDYIFQREPTAIIIFPNDVLSKTLTPEILARNNYIRVNIPGIFEPLYVQQKVLEAGTANMQNNEIETVPVFKGVH